ncbi:hypothetical protein [Streptomyces sp. NPDC097610]|uniref:hypothetical protein n=1 Tax=Streptomyces sp. NPDC097610 TaxID=3157227 RepID=UPI00332832BD
MPPGVRPPYTGNSYGLRPPSTELPIRRTTEKAFLPSLRRLYMTATPHRRERGATRHLGYLEDYRLFIVGMPASEAHALLSDPAHDYMEGPGAPGLQTLVAQAADAWLGRQHAAGREGRLSDEHTNALNRLRIRWGT